MDNTLEAVREISDWLVEELAMSPAEAREYCREVNVDPGTGDASVPELRIEGRPLERLHWRIKHVEGALHIDRCDNLTALPDGLEVDDFLAICDCPVLERLPRGLRAGALWIEGCGALEAYYCGDASRMLDLCGATDNLEIAGWKRCVSLPAGFGSRSLEFKDMEGLASLPEDLTVRTLWLIRCPALRSLPEGLDLDHLYVSNCPGIERRYCGDEEAFLRLARMPRSLSLAGWKTCTSLPERFQVKGALRSLSHKPQTSYRILKESRLYC